MSLTTEAIELLGTLTEVTKALRRFEHPNGANYGVDMATRLEPMIADLEYAIVKNRSREEAAALIEEIHPLMENVNGAATKGDLMIFSDCNNQLLDCYWTRRSIFRESRYSNESL